MPIKKVTKSRKRLCSTRHLLHVVLTEHKFYWGMFSSRWL